MLLLSLSTCYHYYYHYYHYHHHHYYYHYHYHYYYVCHDYHYIIISKAQLVELLSLIQETNCRPTSLLALSTLPWDCG